MTIILFQYRQTITIFSNFKCSKIVHFISIDSFIKNGWVTNQTCIFSTCASISSNSLVLFVSFFFNYNFSFILLKLMCDFACNLIYFFIFVVVPVRLLCYHIFHLFIFFYVFEALFDGFVCLIFEFVYVIYPFSYFDTIVFSSFYHRAEGDSELQQSF